MASLVVSLSTGCFYRRPILEILEPIRRAGFMVLDISGNRPHIDFRDRAAVEKVAGKIRGMGLTVRSIHAPFGEAIDITSPVEEERRRSILEIRAAVEAAMILGAENVVLHPGPDKEDRFPADESVRRMQTALHSLCAIYEICSGLERRLVLENMLPHLFFGGFRDLFWILACLDEAKIGLCLDTGHAQLGGLLEGITPRVWSRLAVVHVSDNHGKQDEHLIPGRGSIDWRRFLRALKETDFSGPVVMEILSSPNEGIEQVLGRAKEGKAFLERTFSSV